MEQPPGGWEWAAVRHDGSGSGGVVRAAARRQNYVSSQPLNTSIALLRPNQALETKQLLHVSRLVYKLESPIMETSRWMLPAELYPDVGRWL